MQQIKFFKHWKPEILEENVKDWIELYNDEYTVTHIEHQYHDGNISVMITYIPTIKL